MENILVFWLSYMLIKSWVLNKALNDITVSIFS